MTRRFAAAIKKARFAGSEAGKTQGSRGKSAVPKLLTAPNPNTFGFRPKILRHLGLPAVTGVKTKTAPSFRLAPPATRPTSEFFAVRREKPPCTCFPDCSPPQI
ncbi:hypothetical protein [Burkholderia sp. 22PA0106]|uniref:hypothetical protein n=1 Tax=Burkholderia sp. 22PA0106 TaxID=3237371 RepID=UPI0039C381C5